MTNFNRFLQEQIELASCSINKSELCRQAQITWPCLWRWATKPTKERPKDQTLWRVLEVLAPYCNQTPQDLMIAANRAILDDFFDAIEEVENG
tara:strand:- start:158 stop:436 length:279 start_codon:yes stop_codon:yes gene_type:complete